MYGRASSQAESEGKHKGGREDGPYSLGSGKMACSVDGSRGESDMDHAGLGLGAGGLCYDLYSSCDACKSGKRESQQEGMSHTWS